MSEELGGFTAAEALERLQIRPQTLYAYVSRGRVQAKPYPNPRCSLYSLPDVERLAKSSRSLRPSAVAASAISWGEPMLASAISTIEAGRLIYRGKDAVALAASATLKSILTMRVNRVAGHHNPARMRPWIFVHYLTTRKF